MFRFFKTLVAETCFCNAKVHPHTSLDLIYSMISKKDTLIERKESISDTVQPYFLVCLFEYVYLMTCTSCDLVTVLPVFKFILLKKNLGVMFSDMRLHKAKPLSTFVCVCMYVFLYLLQTEYQNVHSTSKVRTF